MTHGICAITTTALCGRKSTIEANQVSGRAKRRDDHHYSREGNSITNSIALSLSLSLPVSSSYPKLRYAMPMAKRILTKQEGETLGCRPCLVESGKGLSSGLKKRSYRYIRSSSDVFLIQLFILISNLASKIPIPISYPRNRSYHRALACVGTWYGTSLQRERQNLSNIV